MNQYTSAIIGTALQNGILSSYITDTISTLKVSGGTLYCTEILRFSVDSILQKVIFVFIYLKTISQMWRFNGLKSLCDHEINV